jgi:hypothetical protein
MAGPEDQHWHLHHQLEPQTSWEFNSSRFIILWGKVVLAVQLSTMYWEVEVQLHAFLTQALDGDDWLASCPRCFTPEEGTQWIGGWVGPTAGLDAVMKRTIGMNQTSFFYHYTSRDVLQGAWKCSYKALVHFWLIITAIYYCHIK